MTAPTKQTAGYLALLTLPLWAIPLGWRLAFTESPFVSYTGCLIVGLEAFYLLPLVGAAVVLLWTPIALIRSAKRRDVLRNAWMAAVLFASVSCGLRLGILQWRAGVNRTIARGGPLVDAITKFETQHGTPPISLSNLVPVLLPDVPTTGVGAYPAFNYEREPGRYDGNSWVLRVVPPQPMMGFDVLLYFPRQNYPERGYGGSVEQIGGWGYVHE